MHEMFRAIGFSDPYDHGLLVMLHKYLGAEYPSPRKVSFLFVIGLYITKKVNLVFAMGLYEYPKKGP